MWVMWLDGMSVCLLTSHENGGFHCFCLCFCFVFWVFLWWICVCVLLLGFDSVDESLEEPFSLPTPPFSSYKWVGPLWSSRSSFHQCTSSCPFGLWPFKIKINGRVTIDLNGRLVSRIQHVSGRGYLNTFSEHFFESKGFIIIYHNDSLWLNSTVYIVNSLNRICTKSWNPSMSPTPQQMSIWCPATQGKNYCLSGEPWYPNTNPSNDVFYSPHFCCLLLTGQLWYIKKPTRKPVTLVSGLTCKLITVWGLCISGCEHLCGCFLPDRAGFSKKKHGKNSLAEPLKDHLTHSSLHLGYITLHNSLTGRKHISFFPTNAQNGINHTVSKHS